MTQVRVRYAPSPTGEPHVGNIRTAIFIWLFARRHDGDFIIRIEDTDQSRIVEGAVEGQFEALKWLGIDWDEGPDVGGDFGPYVQSQRLDLYQTTAERLLDTETAYRCYCTPERLDTLRREQSQTRQQVGYDGHCQNLTVEQRKERESSGDLSVVRFRMPSDGETTAVDVIRGEVTFENRLVDDFVILKSDGFPTYHLASVVDDHAMEISHVLRAEEWLPSTPRHLQLYQALGWQPPELAHLPIILAPDKSKLSKRHGATSVLEYREMGFIPDAMVNFLALLGWSLDDKTEVLSKQQLIESFSLERVNKSGAVFNLDKLNSMNGQYLRAMSPDQLADALLSYWRLYSADGIPKTLSREMVLRIVPLIHERLKTLKDAAPLIAFFFTDALDYDTNELTQKGMDEESTAKALRESSAALEALTAFDSESIEGALRPLAEELGLKTRQLLGTLRIATTGLKVAPPLFQTIEILGRQRSLAAIADASKRLANDGRG